MDTTDKNRPHQRLRHRDTAHLDADEDNALVHRLALRLVEHLRMLTAEIDELATEITERVTLIAASLLAIVGWGPLTAARSSGRPNSPVTVAWKPSGSSTDDSPMLSTAPCSPTKDSHGHLTEACGRTHDGYRRAAHLTLVSRLVRPGPDGFLRATPRAPAIQRPTEEAS